MTNATLKVKNGAIQLPKKLQKAWKGARIAARISPDAVVLTKVQTGSFWETWEKIRPYTKDISQTDIKKAIARARKKMRKK